MKHIGYCIQPTYKGVGYSDTLGIDGTTILGGGGFTPRSLSGLDLWLRPESLAALADGAAVASWTDETGTFIPAPDGAGNRPTNQTNELNGHNVVRFDGDDRLWDLDSVAVPATHTLFFVYKPANSGVNRTVLHFGASVNGLQVRHTSTDIIVALKGSVGNVAAGASALVSGTWYIIRITYTGAHGEVFINGVLDGATDVARTFDAGGLSVGSRYTAEHITADMPEVIHYNRVLDAAELAQVESYLATKYALTLNLLHVNSATGNDSNKGTTAAAPLKTLQAAVTKLATTGGTIKVTAAEATPLREEVTHAGAGAITISPVSGNWYHYASQQFTTGWTVVGGGIYSRAITGYPSTLYHVVVTTIDVGGVHTRLTRNASTPTTPAAGEFGVSAGTLYVHLPGDADANANTIEAGKFNVSLLVTGTGRLTLTDGIFRYANSANILVGTDGTSGRLTATGCTAEYNGFTGGFCIADDAVDMTLTNCVSKYSANDGFNVHGNTGVAVSATLTNCEAAYNDDEGVSPHDDTNLTIVGGSYHHNGHAGCAAINNAVLAISGATFNDNGTGTPGPGVEQGHGVAMQDAVSGSVTGNTMTNNVASGIYNTSSGSLAFSGNTSGLAAGNGDADVGA